MNILLAMGLPSTTDGRGYFLWLAHNWQFLMPLALATVVVVFAFVAVVVRMIRRGRGGVGPGAQDQPDTQSHTSDLSGPAGPLRESDSDCRGPWRIEQAVTA